MKKKDAPALQIDPKELTDRRARLTPAEKRKRGRLERRRRALAPDGTIKLKEAKHGKPGTAAG